MSSEVFRGEESSNRIKLSRLVQGLIEFWCYGLPAALERGQVGGGCLGASVGMGVSPHVCTHMHMHGHAHTHMYTCIEIANGHQHGGIHV